MICTFGFLVKRLVGRGCRLSHGCSFGGFDTRLPRASSVLVGAILAASLATALLTRLFGDGGVAIATGVMTVLVLVFGEVLPKTLSITFPEAVAVRVAPVVNLLILVFSPIVNLVRGAVRVKF